MEIEWNLSKEEWQSLSIMCLRDISSFLQDATTNCYMVLWYTLLSIHWSVSPPPQGLGSRLTGLEDWPAGLASWPWYMVCWPSGQAGWHWIWSTRRPSSRPNPLIVKHIFLNTTMIVKLQNINLFTQVSKIFTEQTTHYKWSVGLFWRIEPTKLNAFCFFLFKSDFYQ